MANRVQSMTIGDYIKQNPRHKLVFTKSELSDFAFTDMGYEMATQLANQASPSVVATATFEYVVAKGLQSHPIYGQYLAIKNIGILFEPVLRLNVRLLFESISHDTLLIVCSDGFVQNESYFFNEQSEGFDISLSGLSYLVIE